VTVVTGNGRWQLVLLDALAQAELVGVTAAVDRHLGRRATRVELTAARRTAARLARDGRLTLHQVRVPPGQQARGGLFLAWLGSTPSWTRADCSRPPAAAPGPRGIRPPWRRNAGLPPAMPTKQLLGLSMVDARRVDVDHLPAEEAARLAEQLTVALSEVTGLQRRLRRPRSASSSDPAAGVVG
jgi:hypothetical protein